MAILAAPFILCPFTEGRELLGFSKDQAENKIIFTLGKNIAIRYSVKEQKQEISWTLKIHWFTSKVVFCPDIKKYGAVIDNNIICIWDEDDTSLNESRKYKCTKNVFEILPTMTFGTLVVFKNGVVLRLSEVTTSNKRQTRRSCAVPDGPVDDNSLDILDTHVDEHKNLFFIISGRMGSEKTRTKIGVEKQKALYVHVINIPTATSTAAGVPSLLNTVVISLEDMGKEIIGWCILSDPDVEPSLLHLLSDGTFVKQNLMPKQRVHPKQGHYHKESTEISRFHRFVNTEHPVVIRPCAESTVVVYGCNPSEEGAVVLIYDLKYDLVLSYQSLKLFSSPPMMTKIDNNIFVPLGLNILVIGIRLKRSSLSSVVGQHCLQGVECLEIRDPWKAGWEQKDVSIEAIDKHVSVEDLDESSYEGLDLKDLANTVKTSEKNGHPESLICAQVIPLALEKCNNWRDALVWILEYFADIPDDLLVAMLLPILSDITTTTTTRNKGSTKTEDEDEQSKNYRLISEILKRTFDRHEMVKNLRMMDYTLVKKFLDIISASMMDRPFFDMDVDGNINNESSENVCNVMKWAGALLDSHYTHFVFNNDTELVDKLLQCLEEKMIIMKEIEQIEPLVKIIKSKTKYEPLPSSHSVYRIVNVVFR